MLLELGIVFTVYACVRFFEKNRHSKHAENTSVKQTQLALAETVEAEKKEQQHYLKMSGVAMGIGAIRQFFLTSPPFVLLNIAAFTYIAVPHFKSAENSLLKERKIDGYVLYFLADTTTFALGQYFAAALGVSLFHLSRLVVSRAKGHSKKMLLDVFEQQQPQNVWLLRDGIELEVPLATIKNSDIIIVKTGDIVPVDGIVTEGIASIDQHALTGESRPLEKLPGDQVFAATVVVAGKICIKVEKSGQETTIAKINQILNHSIDVKTNFQLKGEKWADTWALPVLGIAFFSLPLFGPVGFVIIISSHIATKIRVTAPLSTLNYISVAAYKGVLVKDGRALEMLSQVDVVLFDKTGTLTQQENEVTQIIVSSNYQEKEILTYAAAAERYVAHPIAKAILKKAEENHCTIPLVTDESKYQMGYGITVNLEDEDKVIRVGSPRFMLSEGISIPSEIEAAEKQAHLEGHSLVVVAINHQVGGAIELQTMLRPEVKRVLKQLRQTGVKHLAIVSGDHKLPTQKLAKSLGMDRCYYDITPENKADIVEQLQKAGKSVCFVGDGINDAIAMKKANVSISIHGATSIATDVAEIVLMDGTLSHLANVFEISNNLDSKLRSNLKLSFVPSVMKIGGFLLFNFGILTAIFISAIFTLVGVGNAMLPLIGIEHEKTGNKIGIDNKQLTKKSVD
ncbi:MAG: heavy metal translocating P-type ATPase [Candidatus Parabeggiatoa sp. nov. 1]|nr:MAG: heavy metal translocating P-type ATPase [Gammaproteobacteria bacterium]